MNRQTDFYTGSDGYLFISTDSLFVREKARSVASEFELAPTVSGGSSIPRKVPCLLWIRVLNNLDRRTLGMINSNPRQSEKVCQGLDDIHSLTSLIYSLQDEHSFQADFWGINTHYWFHDKDTFIVSDNILCIARTIDASLSVGSVYEALFFNVPLSCSWFNDVNCLEAGERLTYNHISHTVKRSGSSVQDRLNDLPERSVFESTDDFFENAKRSFSNTDCYVCLSAGSDSRTVLAGMRNKNLPINAVSFGNPDYQETALIQKFVRQYGVPWRLVNIDGFEDAWIPLTRRSIVEANGLLNPSRLHYYCLYDSVPSGAPIFEGILGSEFVKAEIAVGAMIGDCHHAVVVEGISVKEALTRIYPELPKDFCESAAVYLTGKFSEILHPIGTEAGRLGFTQYALANIPHKFFSGIVQVAQKHHEMFFPFLSPLIISAVFRDGQGIINSNSLRRDFDSLRSITAQSEIVRCMDNSLYRSLLDRNITFEEAEYCPKHALKIKRKFRSLGNRIMYRRYYYGQVDNSELNALKRMEAERSAQRVAVLPVDIQSKSSVRLIDLLVNLLFLEEAVRASPRYFDSYFMKSIERFSFPGSPKERGLEHPPQIPQGHKNPAR